MSFGFKSRRARERRRRHRKVWGWFFLFLVIVGLGAYSWYAGRELARADLKQLQDQVTELTSKTAALQTQTDQARAAEATAQQDAADWKSRYQQDVPTGQGQEIYQDIQALLGQGVEADRVRLILDAARKAQTCSPEQESKRFAVMSPLTRDPVTPVNFDGNSFILSAEGQSATLDTGEPAAWFDTSKPVTVHFTVPGGETTDATGVLPIQHSIARGDTEYRFAISYDNIRGYVRATLAKCSL
jgi:outer membrane murein-binding lipoprotein Lpp